MCEDFPEQCGCGLCTAKFNIDPVNISANVTSLAHVWVAAQNNPRFQQDYFQASRRAEGLYQQSIMQLQSNMQSVGAQTISNIMWSSTHLGYNPDDIVSGMVHRLTMKFLQLIHAVTPEWRPNAQGSATFLWAFTTMHHPAASNEVLESVLESFNTGSGCTARRQCTAGCQGTAMCQCTV